MRNKITNRILKAIIARVELHKLTKFGVSWKDLIALHKEQSNGISSLFNKSIKISNDFWHLFGLKEIFLDETYRFKTSKECPYIIDCGANIGLSVIYFKQLFPNAKIDCFEPDKEIFKLLKYNLEQFNKSNISFYQKAIWKNNEGISFKSDGAVGGHITNKDDKSEKMPSQRLKDLLDNKVDFLKIDIEGAEYEVLVDCKEKLLNVENIFIEYHSFHESEQKIAEILAILKVAGFRVYIKEAWENMISPFNEKKGPFFDLQLNIFGYRM